MMANDGYQTTSNGTSGAERAIGRSSRHMSFIASFLISLCLAISTAIANDVEREQNAPARVHQGNGGGFYAANTEQEKSLDAIFKFMYRKPEGFYFIIKAPWRDKSKDTTFFSFFSSKLQKSWEDEEARLVKLACDGEYIDGIFAV
jgi:hypothetical protein